MKQQRKNKIHFAWWVLLGAAIMLGLTRGGLNNSAGLFLAPVTEDLNIGLGSLMLYFSIASIVTMIFLPIAGKMVAKYNLRMLLIVAVILMAGSFAMFGLMNSVWGWYLFSIPMAIGSIFLTQIAGPVLINNWFKKHNGLVMGIMMAITGAFSAILQPTVGNLIADEGWRNTYIILGLAVMAIVIPVVFFTIRKTPQQKGLQPYGADEAAQAQAEDAPAAAPERGVTAAAARKSSTFYALLLFFFFVTSIASFSQHVGPFAVGLGYDITFAGSAMGGWMVGSLVGALTFGILTDKIGAQVTAISAMLLGLAPIAILLTAPTNPTMFTLALVIFGFVSASIGTLAPLLTTALFGNKEYSQIFANAALGLAVAGMVALPGYGFVYQLTNSYSSVLYAIAGMMVINAVLIVIAFRGKKKLVESGAWS